MADALVLVTLVGLLITGSMLFLKAYQKKFYRPEQVLGMPKNAYVNKMVT